jgi:hypothetical protein
MVAVFTDLYIKANVDHQNQSAGGELATFVRHKHSSDEPDIKRVWIAPLTKIMFARYRVVGISLGDPKPFWLRRLKEDSKRFEIPSGNAVSGEVDDEIFDAVNTIIGET